MPIFNISIDTIITMHNASMDMVETQKNYDKKAQSKDQNVGLEGTRRLQLTKYSFKRIYKG